MSTWKELDLFRKILLILVAVSTAITLIALPFLRKQVGIRYEDTLFLRSEEGENTVYTGKVAGEAASFTVTPHKAVTYRQGEKVFGPYTAVADPSAKPADEENELLLRYGQGIEVRENGKVVFRGAVADLGGSLVFWEEGKNMDFSLRVSAGGPDLNTLLDTAYGPDLAHRGNGQALALGLLCAVLTVISIFFADALFRWDLRWRVRDPERAEPSDWELFSRGMGQVVLAGGAVIAYIICLTSIQPI